MNRSKKIDNSLATDVMMQFFKSFDDEVEGKSARGIATAAGSGLDHALYSLLKPLIRKDIKGNDIFQYGKPLGQYDFRVTMAHALGLITDKEKRELNLLGKIRNQFAHDPGDVSFDAEGIKDRCLALELGEKLHAPRVIPFRKGEGSVYPHGYDQDGYPIISAEELVLQNAQDPQVRFVASVTVMMNVLAARTTASMTEQPEAPREFEAPEEVRAAPVPLMEEMLISFKTDGETGPVSADRISIEEGVKQLEMLVNVTKYANEVVRRSREARFGPASVG